MSGISHHIKFVIEPLFYSISPAKKRGGVPGWQSQKDLTCFFFLPRFVIMISRSEVSHPLYACIKVGERLNDPPHTEREVGRKPHESAKCGRSVGARSAERSGYQVLTPTSL